MSGKMNGSKDVNLKNPVFVIYSSCSNKARVGFVSDPENFILNDDLQFAYNFASYEDANKYKLSSKVTDYLKGDQTLSILEWK